MSQDADGLLAEGIAAFNRQSYTDARALLSDAVLADPHNLRAWIWLSAALPDAGERCFCLNYVLKHDPKNEAATQGLQTIPAQTPPKAPFQMQTSGMPLPRCQALGCRNQVANPQHPLCRQHWKSLPREAPPPAPDPTTAALTASMLGEQLNLPSNRVNLMLAEIGWLDRDGSGWRCTPQGQAAGGVQRVHTVSGVPFVVWPATIVGNAVLQAALNDFKGESSHKEPISDSGFRERFPATHRTTDGHLVRSKAEQLVDNWLYMAGIVHAYERRLPIEEELYCDFYIPGGKVFIEYWGLETDPQYQARQQHKRAIYQKYSFNLIELTEKHIRNLDDFLPRLLRQFGIDVQ